MSAKTAYREDATRITGVVRTDEADAGAEGPPAQPPQNDLQSCETRVSSRDHGVPASSAPGSSAAGSGAAGSGAAGSGATGSGATGSSTQDCGALTYSEAADLLGRDELAVALREGRWVQLWSGVVVPGHRAGDPRTRAGAALLRAGPHAVLSGATAVAMHGCSAADSGTLEVTIPYDRQLRSAPGLSVRQARVRERDVQWLDGLRVFALDVALAELLCTGPQRVALASLEQALAQLAAEGGQAERFRRLVAERLSRRVDRRGTRRAAGLLQLAWTGPPADSAIGAGRFGRSVQAGLGEAS